MFNHITITFIRNEFQSTQPGIQVLVSGISSNTFWFSALKAKAKQSQAQTKLLSVEVLFALFITTPNNIANKTENPIAKAK